MTDVTITADASTMTGAEFFARLFPKPNPEMLAEQRQARLDWQAATQASYQLPTLIEGIERRAELTAEYQARLGYLDALYADHSRRLAGQSATHCINGHEFTATNTYFRPGSRQRICRQCSRDRNARCRERRRERKAAEAAESEQLTEVHGDPLLKRRAA